MIDDHGVAVDSQIADESDDAAVGGFRRVIFRDGQVVTDVISVVDRFAFVSVGSGVRKIRLDFGIGELIKSAVPENRRGGFLGDRPDLVFVLFAKVFIYFYEDVFRASLAGADVMEQGRHFALDKLVGNRQRTFLVFDVLKLVDKSHFSRVAGFI